MGRINSRTYKPTLVLCPSNASQVWKGEIQGIPCLKGRVKYFMEDENRKEHLEIAQEYAEICRPWLIIKGKRRGERDGQCGFGVPEKIALDSYKA